MKITEPKIESRTEQPYMGIRTQTSVQELGSVIPRLLGDVFGWLGERSVSPVGAPFLRYHVINMAENLDIELGVPIATTLSDDGRVTAGVIPAGRYASLIYTGVENGYEGNKVLIDWAAEKGIQWDRWDDKNGDAFRSRMEVFLTAPDEEPDMAKWETEVAIKLADDPVR